MIWQLLLGAETLGGYPRGPFCPAGLLCLNGTMFVQIINFFVLVLVLNFVFYKPIQKVIEERQTYILTNRATAQQRLEEAKKLATDYEAQLVDTRREAQDLIAQAETDAQKIRADRLAQVQQEAQARLESARAEVQQAKAVALANLPQEVNALSAQITSKLLATR